MADEIDFENGRISNFQRHVILTLTIGPGHMVYRRASLTDPYLRTKFHWDRTEKRFSIFFQVQSHVTQKTRAYIENPARTNLDFFAPV